MMEKGEIPLLLSREVQAHLEIINRVRVRVRARVRARLTHLHQP